MGFQFILVFKQFLINVRHQLFQGRVVFLTFFLVYLGKFGPTLRAHQCNLLRCANSGNNILALCIDEVFAVEHIFSRTCISCKTYSGSGIFTHVAKDHGLHVHCSAPIFGITVHFSVVKGTVAVPAIEYRGNGTPKLVPWIVGKGFSCSFFNDFLKIIHQILKVLNGKLGVVLNSSFIL